MMVDLLKRLRNGLHWLWRQEGSVGQRCRGLAAGVFAGCFPFFGFQTLFGIGLATLLRGNRILAAAGTWISNPFTYVPLYWFNYTLGSHVLGESPTLDFSPELTWNRNVWSLGGMVASRLLLGSAIVGFVLATAAGFLSWLWLRRSRPAP